MPSARPEQRLQDILDNIDRIERPSGHVGSFAEATRFQLRVALTRSYAERLRDLEAMWDFNDMVEARNPRVRDVAARLRAHRIGRGR